MYKEPRRGDKSQGTKDKESKGLSLALGAVSSSLLCALGCAFCVGCAPIANNPPPTTALLLQEDGVDFADFIDAPNVLTLRSQGGRAIGALSAEANEPADVDVLRVAVAPGKLVRFVLRPGSSDAGLEPFLFITDAKGEILGLHNGAALQKAQVAVIAPSRAEVFAIIQDARSINGEPVANAPDYSLNIVEEERTFVDLGVANPGDTLTANGVISPEANEALFSVTVQAGTTLVITVAPSRFQPFMAVYTSSFDLGLTTNAERGGATLQSDFLVFGEGEESVLFGVSELGGNVNEPLRFTLSLLPLLNSPL